MLEVFIYLIIFIIGTLFGSFFSLAIYRLPIKQSIMHGRSYCPKCNHKLGFLDLIPVMSYICLGAKCRYCKEKIRGRYIYLEAFSGITFLLFALSLKINIYNLEVAKIVYLIFGFLYLSTLFIIGGIEKETHTISRSVLAFGLIVESAYIIYLYIIGASIYRYVIYLCLLSIFLLIDTITLKKYAKNNYTYSIIITLIIMAIFTGEYITIYSLITTLILLLIYKISSKFKNLNIKEDKKENIQNMKIGFCLGIFNIIYFMEIILYSNLI